MKNALVLLLGLFVASPLLAQDEMAEEPAAEEEAAPADDTASDDAGADDAGLDTEPLAEGSDTGESTDTAEAEDTGEESGDTAEATEEGGGMRLYVGFDAVNNTIDVSSSNTGEGGADFDTKLYRLRVGTRITDEIGAEVHYGVDRSDKNEVETDSYYGLFLVPTATLFDTVELAFPVGFAKYDAGGASDDGMAYGLDFELPIRRFGEDLPDIRATLGYMVYYQNEPARVYGANFGLRWDFDTSMSMGNPFEGAGAFFSSLWPWGDDEAEEGAEGEEAPAEEEPVE